ncbi:glucosylglycerol hydrolase [Haloferax denitrificans]|uniref:glucosylglycerol hydrolase n=1 Tax=Haloferax denitrificans TaxID=35745 RepID=UPI003C6F767B
MSTNSPTPTLHADRTDDLASWHESVVESRDDDFSAAKTLTTKLGAHRRDEVVEFGFWTPDLVEDGVPEAAVELELLTPPADLDPGETDHRRVTFDRHRVPTRRVGEYHWAAVEGVRAGTRDTLGALYRLVYEGDDGEERTVQDPVAYSVPFGAFAPAEVYDLDRLDETRADRAYFEALGTDDERVATTDDGGLPRIDPATSMLEIHPGTATERGSLAGLAEVYEGIAAKQRAGDDLAPWERAFAGYDGIQLMPVEPLTENEAEHDFWTVADGSAGEVTVDVARPEMINWGYDIVVSAFSAPNPAVLETGRPDELVDFIAACHDLPRPIKVVFDIALGHADNRGAELLSDRYVLGPGMYGKHLDYTEPTARAVFLEMQERKMDFGADGIRVDGAQDFTSHDPETGEMYHDDDFLAEMDRVTQEVAGTEYRPWMIYEDGRPWPREDWELASSYRALIEQHPHSFQWSPITFAHNTPALLTFWATKWWRVREVGEFGGNWLTGVANHDTVRRGTQIDPTVEFNQSPVNPYLGDDYPETLSEAYDNAASSMLFHCFLPGVPMDFVHANMRAPWGFVRDTDPTWNVKVVSDESKFCYWQVRDEDFEDDRFFRRVKDLGFDSREGLLTFMNALSSAVGATDYDLDVMADMLSAMDQPLGDDLSAADLEAYGYAWMRDVHDFANLVHWRDEQDDERTAFRLETREFRHDRPWLIADLDAAADYFTYRHPTDGTVLYYGFRTAPDGGDATDSTGGEQLLFAANMEGVPVEVSPATLADDAAGDANAPAVPTDGWEPALVAPGVEEPDGSTAASNPLAVELANGAAVVWRRDP